MPGTKIVAFGLLDSLRLDARWVLRQIRNSVAFSAIVVVLLAAGLGAATAIFSTVRTVLLSPLPYKDPEQLVQIISTWPKTGDKNDWSAPYRDALDWKTANRRQGSPTEWRGLPGPRCHAEGLQLPA